MMPNEIIDLINQTFSVNILNNSRERELVENRIIFAKIVRDNFKISLPRIGNFVNKNHATIIHYLKQHEALFEYDKFYRLKYEKICKLIYNDNYIANEITQLNQSEFKILKYETIATSKNKISA